MLVVFDIGNTNIALGIFEEDKLLDNWKIPTDVGKTQVQYGKLIEKGFTQRKHSLKNITGIVIGSVVPAVTPKIKKAAQQIFSIKPMIVSGKSKLPIKLSVENPKGVGADIIADCVVAHNLFSGTSIAIDLGTATTFNVVSNNAYIGSVIAPGLSLMTEYLAEKTALLPKIKFNEPQSIIGKTTIDCMKSGIFYGYIGLVENILKKIKTKYKDATVIVTGGNSSLIASRLRGIDKIEPNLTLEGLCITYSFNKQA